MIIVRLKLDPIIVSFDLPSQAQLVVSNSDSL